MGLRKAELSRKNKYKCRNPNKLDTVMLRGVVITVLSFALLRGLWKFSEMSLFTGLEVRFHYNLCCQS